MRGGEPEAISDRNLAISGCQAFVMRSAPIDLVVEPNANGIPLEPCGKCVQSFPNLQLVDELHALSVEHDQLRPQLLDELERAAIAFDLKGRCQY
jgi:hypothetical protein